MSKYQPIHYHFHALGHAFSGQFSRPVPVPVEALASVALPTNGGHGYARVDNFHIPRLVTFKAAYSHVSGSKQDDDTFATQVTTTIEGLRILDFLTADRIVARLTSEHKRGEEEGHILALGSTFENLRIGGHAVNITLRHGLLLECKTFEHLRKQVTKTSKSGKIPGVSKRKALCSLVETIEPDKLPGVEQEGHVLHVKHFGQISFAEILAEPGKKTLTMLRLKLGSPDDADLSAAEGVLNGTHWP